MVTFACSHTISGEAVRAGATAVRGHVWPVDVAQARAPPPLATRWPVEVGAQARAPPHLATGGQYRWVRVGAPPHLATGGQYRWCGQEATVCVATRGRERRREQGQRSAWLRVVRRGGASKGNGARGHAWPREAARARTTDNIYTWPRVAASMFFTWPCVARDNPRGDAARGHTCLLPAPPLVTTRGWAR